MKDGWLDRLRSPGRRLRRSFSALAWASLLVAGQSLSAEDMIPRWYEPFGESAKRADKRPRSPVRFVWQDDELSESPEDREHPIRRAAYQNQYPLSKDSEDLLPREESQAPSDDMSTSDDPLFSDKDGESPWIEWKKTVGTATWIAPSSDGLGITSLEARGSIEFPKFQALWFVPRLAGHALDGPTMTDLDRKSVV